MHYVCADCGATYDGDLRKQWGRTKQTDGLGQAMKCVNLIPVKVGGVDSNEVCGGGLALVADDDTRDPESVVDLTPLTEK